MPLQTEMNLSGTLFSHPRQVMIRFTVSLRCYDMSTVEFYELFHWQIRFSQPASQMVSQQHRRSF